MDELVIIKKIFKEIKKFKIKGLISISLIGSFQYSKKLDYVNDIDLIVLVKKVTPDLFNLINKSFNSLIKNFQEGNLKFVVENRIGPFKPKKLKKKKVIQFHLLIYDYNRFYEAVKRGNPSRYDWINFNKTIKGKSLSSLFSMGKISKQELLKDLKIHLKNIEGKKALTDIYKIKNNEIELQKKFLKIKKDEYVEMFCFVIITNIMNYLRLFKPNLKKDQMIILKEANKILPYRYYSIIGDAFGYKKRVRSKKGLTLYELSKFEKEAKEFLRFLIKKIKV